LECHNDNNRRMRVFGNRVVRKIFGSKADEVTAEWRRLHREDLNPLNAELNPICHLLALLGAHHILHVSRIRGKDRMLLHVSVL